MIYKIDNKYYVKVQGHYKECDMSLKDDELIIKLNGNEIESYNIDAMQVSSEYVKEQLKQKETFQINVKEQKNKKRW